MEVSMGIWRIFDIAFELLRLKATYIDCSKTTAHLRKCLCEFQLEFTNYQFDSSQYHKRFKASLDNNSEDSDRAYKELTDFSEQGLKVQCGAIADYIQKYFSISHRHTEKTRIGIYGANHEGDLLDIIKLGAESLDKPKKIDDYSCFSEVCKKGTPYLDNSLPKTIIMSGRKDNGYRHKGIDLERVSKEYKIKFSDRKWSSRWVNNVKKKSKEDELWHSMSAKDDASNGSLYKSQLVIPVTFRQHAQKERLNDDLIKILQLNDGGRSILGFICIDHASTYYFDDKDSDSFDNLDINIMYIFADLLSLVQITHWMYTSGSTSYSGYVIPPQEVKSA